MANLNETIKYLDLTGLAAYDTLIKQYSDDKDGELKTYVDGLIGEGGSVSQQIENAVNALKGTLSESDAKTLEAINDELDGIDGEISTLKGDVTTAGSVAKAVKDGIDAIGSGTAQGTAGQALVSLTQTNGVVTATAGDVAATHVTTSFTGQDPVSTTTNVQASLEELYDKVADNAEASEVAVYEGGSKVSTIAADGKTYTIKQGTNTVATINIAKDMVVSSGSVITATGSETDVPTGQSLIVGEKYVRLVIKDSVDGKNIYIAVQDLYDDYTFNDGDEIDFTETNNAVSAIIKTGSIAEGKLTTALQNKINSAATVVNEKSTGHVTVAVTAASGANPAQVTISENDIASAADLTGEITRAKSAETSIDSAVGLTKAANSETRTWTPTTNYKASGNTHTVANNMGAIDAQLKSVSDFIGNMTAISNQEITNLFVQQSGN